MSNNRVIYLSEVKKAEKNGEYTTKIPYISLSEKLLDNHIFEGEEDKAVTWHRAKVKEHNEQIERSKQDRINDERSLNKKRYDDVVAAIVYEYNFNREQAQLIYDEAVDRASSVLESIDTAESIADFVQKIIESGKK